MEKTYHYYAFISYSTKDSKWAKWLQHQLSYYHIPSSVRKSKIGVPKKLQPIFIYEYDLAGNQLHEVIKKELIASKYLIVICSPSAAKSKYVNDEVLEFIRDGREDSIIPFIIDGEVNSSNSTQECFPPALRELLKNKELRGENIAQNGTRQALVGVIATMLGIRRDMLWNRYKVRRLKQRIIMAGVAVLALLCGLFYWDYTRPTYKYFADYTDVWGVPTGILELSKEQVKHRNSSYCFEYRRVPLKQPNAYSWRLAQVLHVNSADTPKTITETAYIDRYPIQKLTYSQDNGVLTDIIYCNEMEQAQMIHHLSRNSDTPAAIVDITSVVAGDGVAFAKSISAISADNKDEKSNITRYVYERNSGGYITKVTFHANNSLDFNSSAVADNFGVWGIAYELDSLGRRKSIRYLDKDGSFHCNNIGVSTRRYEFDSMGNVCAEQILDLQGNPTLNENMWSVAYATFDNYGNYIEESYYNIIGKPSLHKDNYAKYIAKYDDRGNLIEVSLYGIDGKPCLSNEGYAKWSAKYDDRGNRIEVSYYGIDGKPCLSNYGYAKCTTKYDDRGNQIEVSIYGIDGKPCLSIHGYYSIKLISYNDRSQVIALSYYDTENKPVNVGGYFKEVRIYDENNKQKETIYYDKHGKLLAERIFTRQITFVQGAALSQSVPIGSIVLKFNDWEIGDTQTKYLHVEKRDRYAEKKLYYLTPTGEIGYLYVKAGLMGIN